MNTAEKLIYDEKTRIVSVADKPSERKHITNIEEYLRIPQEDREKAIIETKFFFDNAKKLLPEAIKEAVKEQLERGTPISYGDADGNVLRRYPDGRIFLVEIDMESFKQNETFLRMATPEDNYSIYG